MITSSSSGFLYHGSLLHYQHTDTQQAINHILHSCRRRGLRLWAPSSSENKQLKANTVAAQLREGIDNGGVVVVVLTRALVESLQQNSGDFFEAIAHTLKSHDLRMILGIVLHHELVDQQLWPSVLKSVIGKNACIDMSNKDLDIVMDGTSTDVSISVFTDAVKKLIQQCAEGNWEITPPPPPPPPASLRSGRNQHSIRFGGTEYKGTVLHGSSKEGVGSFICKAGRGRGNRFVGEFTDTIPDGQGKFTFVHGEVYDGTYRNGQKNGQGLYRFNSGAQYMGNYCDGKKHGIGTFRSRTDSVYCGEYSHGRKNGFGTVVFASGDQYEGNYINDRRCGTGRYLFSGRGLYTGEYADDRKHGMGCLVEDGQVIVGEFVGGVQHGFGRVVKSDGSIVVGVWREGILLS